MHNGGVAHFSGSYGVGAVLYEMLPPEYREIIKGNTDSEMVFALFLSLLPHKPLTDSAVVSAGSFAALTHAHKDSRYSSTPRKHVIDADTDFTAEEMALALKHAIQTLEYLSMRVAAPRAAEPSSYNFAVTNGKHLLCTRYRNDPDDEPPSLYFALGPGSLQIDSTGLVHNVSSDAESTMVLCVASEPLSTAQHWKVVPPNSMLVASFGEGARITDSYLEDLGFPDEVPPMAAQIDMVFTHIQRLHQASEEWRAKLQQQPQRPRGKTSAIPLTFGQQRTRSMSSATAAASSSVSRSSTPPPATADSAPEVDTTKE